MPQSEAPCTCDSAPSGLTTVPQSTTRSSFSTFTTPLFGSTRTRAAQATQVGMSRSWPKVVARPMPVFFGSGLPHPALAATFDSTAACRCAPPVAVGPEPALRPAASSSFSRKARGSAPTLWAASSMKLSSAQLVQPGPTERSQPGRKVALARSLFTARTRCAPTVYQWSAPLIAKGS